MNGELRLLQFNQGTDLDAPPTGDTGGNLALANNAGTSVPGLTLDSSLFVFMLATCYLYRRVDGTYKWMRLDFELVYKADGATNALKFEKSEAYRKESAAFGLTVTLDTSVAGKATPVFTLDNMAGVAHACTLYYKLNTMIKAS
jgi:hypothetical protein